MFRSSLAMMLLLAAQPALSQAPDFDTAPALRLEGDAALLSDFRFRGISQSDLLPAVEGGLVVRHATGLHAGVRATTVAGWGRVGGAPVLLDLNVGYATVLGDARIDAGLTWHLYPGGAPGFGELNARLGGTIGPLSLLGGIAWAPPQAFLGNWSGTPDSRPGDTGSNLYLRADAAVAVLGTPLTLAAHVGHSAGDAGLGPDGYSLTPVGAYWDWRIGIDYGLGPLTLGLAVVDTDIDSGRLRQLRSPLPAHGLAIAGRQLVVSIRAAF
jgi:uncharacterized protein (TIGR02001 family)